MAYFLIILVQGLSYIPLGGSRHGTLISVRNVFIIFLISGFWHGASWNFIVWGGIHACGFLPLLLLNKNRKYIEIVAHDGRLLPSFKEIVKIIFTFSFVTLAWIFFRQQTLNDAFGYISHMFSSVYQDPNQFLSKPTIGLNILLLVSPIILLDWLNRSDERNFRVPRNILLRMSIYIIMTFLIFTLFTKSSNTMIYFQF